MTDTPNRTIGGLTTRSSTGQPDLSRLQRRNRLAVPLAADRDRVENAAVTSIARPAASTTSVSVEAPTVGTEHAATQDRITVYLDHELRGRARSAYRATAHLEGDRTWSDFIERAIRAEVQRREQAHNANQPYSSSIEKLPPGRTVS